MSVHLSPWARDKMKPADKAEVYAYEKAHPGAAIHLGYRTSEPRGFYAEIGSVQASGALTPMDAFHKAVIAAKGVDVLSVLSPGAA